jgi:hypothetical protein
VSEVITQYSLWATLLISTQHATGFPYSSMKILHSWSFARSLAMVWKTLRHVLT